MSPGCAGAGRIHDGAGQGAGRADSRRVALPAGQGRRHRALHAFVDSKLIQEYKTRQSKLEGDYQEGLKTYKPGYPKMQQMESQIKELQAKINQEIQGRAQRAQSQLRGRAGPGTTSSRPS